jgi:hypothetical protein
MTNAACWAGSTVPCMCSPPKEKESGRGDAVLNLTIVVLAEQKIRLQYCTVLYLYKYSTSTVIHYRKLVEYS